MVATLELTSPSKARQLHGPFRLSAGDMPEQANEAACQPHDVPAYLFSKLTEKASEQSIIASLSTNSDGLGGRMTVEDSYLRNYWVWIRQSEIDANVIHVGIDLMRPGQSGAITMSVEKAIAAFDKIHADKDVPFVDALIAIIPGAQKPSEPIGPRPAPASYA